jgi:hypothetical protein
MERYEKFLRTAQRRQSQKEPGAVRIGDTASRLMIDRISPLAARFGTIVESFKQLLPAELCRHCEIVGISGGQLTVEVDSPSFRYELQLCSFELLKELQRRCPSARLTKIKTVHGSSPNNEF